MLTLRRVLSNPEVPLFERKQMASLLKTYFREGLFIDPFCGSPVAANNLTTNDIDPTIKADSHKEALDFLREIPTSSVDGVIYNPPYSPKRIKEFLRKGGYKESSMKQYTKDFHKKRKDEVSRILRKGGIVLSVSGSSLGMTKERGFSLKEVLYLYYAEESYFETVITIDQKIN